LTPKKTLKVLLDTNFLMIPLRFGVDIFSEMASLLGGVVEPVVTQSVLDEIHLLMREAKPSFNRELEFALKMSLQCIVIDDERRLHEKVDDSLIRIAVDNGFIVGTTDADLRRRLRAVGVPALYLRQSNRLCIEGISQ
jgi:rRNA-processing protein FCF1